LTQAVFQLRAKSLAERNAYTAFLAGHFELAANGLALGEGGDFQHQLSYKALKFICIQNCPTKH